MQHPGWTLIMIGVVIAGVTGHFKTDHLWALQN